MELQTACTALVRYMEDNRDNFRVKAKTESWTKFLLGDIYARRMIDQIVNAAKDYVHGDQLITNLDFAVTNRDGNVQNPAEDHEIVMEPADQTRRGNRGVGSLVLRVHLHRKYTASVYLQF